MSRLGARLLKLEDRRRHQLGSKLPPEAVFEAPLPREDLDSWARALVDELGVQAPCIVTVTEAAARKVVVPRAFYDDLDEAQQRIVLRATSGPHVTIWLFEGGLIAERFDDEAHIARWIEQLKRELAQEGYRVDLTWGELCTATSR